MKSTNTAIRSSYGKNDNPFGSIFLILQFLFLISLYSSFQLAKKYLDYYFHASNGRGHGVHSPFVFDFIKQVLKAKPGNADYADIEKLRTALLHNRTMISVADYGAGSAVIKTSNRAVNKIAASSLKPKKFARLLSRIVKYYKPRYILELGTSFGITTAYLASANPQASVYTLEGASSIAAIAKQHFEKLGLKNIELVEGDFQQSLPTLLSGIEQVDLAFIDGNHRKQPTLEYFHQLLIKATPTSILIFDDIHWSVQMEEAWLEICRHPAVTLSIDLFFIGIVFINPDFKVKQDFQIRF